MKLFLSLVCIVFALTSCGSYKKTSYFQDVNLSSKTIERIKNFSPITVQPEDILGISISSLNPESSTVFNFTSNTVNGTNENYGGYLVDQQGQILLPIIGNVKVSNLTTAQVKEKIRLKLLEYLKEPVVILKLLNFKVSVMGDVSQPGVFKIPNERLTLTEALSLAGDLNITALRQILIIREVDGNREYIPIDLSKKEVFSSPYYYLKNNDVIYVQAGRAKYAAVDRTIPQISLLLSVISVAAIFLTRK
ncbi:polysaccharide biosynthesis/export family protein [Mucilaginibacter sp.]|uniref:polysaccharide biosynthesis/export family protein n=1 Tax=Mucilaginibacter sp. TaxID=1882438 RepID=UPI00262D5822|nr:polysaccharide biosynthesis/export family protein [Mucilaginibacter sp.]MDB5126979.1 sugar transporter [Mucilaginibacter sp.]